MKVQLKPIVKFDNEKESEIFLNCLNTLKRACIEMPECAICPWVDFCKKNITTTLVDFFSNLETTIIDFEE